MKIPALRSYLAITLGGILVLFSLLVSKQAGQLLIDPVLAQQSCIDENYPLHISSYTADNCPGNYTLTPSFDTQKRPPSRGTFTFKAPTAFTAPPQADGFYHCKIKVKFNDPTQVCDLKPFTSQVLAGATQILDFYFQNQCGGDGMCVATVKVRSPTASATPIPSLSPAIAPQLIPNPTIQPLPQTTSFPASTQQPVSGASPTSSIRVAPAILNPTAGAVLTGLKKVDVRATEESTVELRLQPSIGPTGTLHLGLVKVATGQTTVSYNWETKNTPNGRYKLYAVVTEPGNSQIIVGPVEVTLDNSAAAVTIAQKVTVSPPAPITKPLTSPQPPKTTPSQPGQTPTPTIAQSEIVTETIADIVFPSQFNSAEVKVDNNTKITKVENEISSTGEVALKISGQTLPHKVITILIYSSPIVVTVKTDANGVWSYRLEKPLAAGKHIVYTVVPRVEGSKVRSEVTSFFISPVYAASTNNESLVLASATSDEPLKKFALITATVVAVGVASLLLTFRFFKKKEAPVSQ